MVFVLNCVDKLLSIGQRATILHLIDE